MKLLFDQNRSHRILKITKEDFPDSTAVKNENLLNSADKVIWDFAKKSNYIVVTLDSDFNDFNILYGFPPKII